MVRIKHNAWLFPNKDVLDRARTNNNIIVLGHQYRGGTFITTLASVNVTNPTTTRQEQGEIRLGTTADSSLSTVEKEW